MPTPQPQPPPRTTGNAPYASRKCRSKTSSRQAALKCSRAARQPHAQSTGGKLWAGSLLWCLPNVHAHIRRSKAFHATAQTQAIEARAAWRRRHHRNRRPPTPERSIAHHLHGALPRLALSYASTKLGTPGRVVATTPQTIAGTSLRRGPNLGRRGCGL